MYYGKRVPVGTQMRVTEYEGLSKEVFKYECTSTVQGFEKLKQNIIALLHTRPKERFFEPTLGSDLISLVFEPNDFVLRDSIIIAVKDCIKENVPEVSVVDLKIKQYDTIVEIWVSYEILSVGIIDELIVYVEKQI